MTCDHGIPLNRWCADCNRSLVFIEETPAEHRRRWLSTWLLIIAFLMGLGALALAARQVFEWLGGAA